MHVVACSENDVCQEGPEQAMSSTGQEPCQIWEPVDWLEHQSDCSANEHTDDSFLVDIGVAAVLQDEVWLCPYAMAVGFMTADYLCSMTLSLCDGLL